MAYSTITVSTDAIAGLATDLATLYKDFDSVPDTGDTINDAIGSGTVRDAVHEFANNWSSHRKRLLESVGAVRDSAKQAHTSFTKTDVDLANNILGKKP